MHVYRIILAVVLLLASALWADDARASCTTTNAMGYLANCDSEAEAHAFVTAISVGQWMYLNPSCGRQVTSVGTAYKSGNSWRRSFHVYGSCGGGFDLVAIANFPAASACPSGTTPEGGACITPCSARPDQTLTGPPDMGGLQQFQSGDEECVSGCLAITSHNADDTWNRSFVANSACTFGTPEFSQQCRDRGGQPVGGLFCTYPKQQCEDGQTVDAVTGQCTTVCPEGQTLNAQGFCESKMDTCPHGYVKVGDGAYSSCLPGEGMCSAGEAKRNDGSCGKDANGDGVADDEDDDPNNDSEKNSFSGGDTCDQPPSCSGDPIMCGQARLQWRIECNTRRDMNISGGACNAMPVCAGKNCNAMEHAQLIQQWKASCALEKMANSGGETGGEDSDDPYREVDGSGALGEEGSPDGAFTDGSANEGGTIGGRPPGIDDTGYGWTRSCPVPPVIDINGHTIELPLDLFCRWVELGGQLVLILTALWCVRYMAAGGSA